MRLRRMLNALILSALASALVYAVMLAVGDGREALAILSRFPLTTVTFVLLLSLGCFVIRAVRWAFLMGITGHAVSFREAMYLQLSGQTMAISPGRVGEVLKPWLAKEGAGMPMSKGVALIFAERVGDLIGVCVLSVGALAVMGTGVWALVAGFALLAVGTLVASSGWFHSKALNAVERQAWGRKHRDSLTTVSQTLRSALAGRPLIVSVFASVIAWGLEGVGLALCLQVLGVDSLGVLGAVSLYAISTIAGALTFMPGGIGVTEASLAGMLVLAGADAASASAATLVIRVCTLWWGVGLGWAVMMARPSFLTRLLSPAEGT